MEKEQRSFKGQDSIPEVTKGVLISILKRAHDFHIIHIIQSRLFPKCSWEFEKFSIMEGMRLMITFCQRGSWGKWLIWLVRQEKQFVDWFLGFPKLPLLQFKALPSTGPEICLNYTSRNLWKWKAKLLFVVRLNRKHHQWPIKRD